MNINNITWLFCEGSTPLGVLIHIGIGMDTRGNAFLHSKDCEQFITNTVWYVWLLWKTLQSVSKINCGWEKNDFQSCDFDWNNSWPCGWLWVLKNGSVQKIENNYYVARQRPVRNKNVQRSSVYTTEKLNWWEIIASSAGRLMRWSASIVPLQQDTVSSMTSCPAWHRVQHDTVFEKWQQDARWFDDFATCSPIPQIETRYVESIPIQTVSLIGSRVGG